jgi:serine/threonine-protein kinase
VKIADFGIARAAFQALDAKRQRAGTVGYMAPEQSSGERVDARTDVYGVGAVLVRALTGKTALPGEAPELPATTPRALAPILLRALAVRAQDRYPSATAMLQDLEVLAQREGILASPRALAALVRQHLDARAARGGAKPRALDELVRARARAIAGAAGTEPFSEGTNIVLAHVEGVTEIRIVMPEPLTLPEPPAAAASSGAARPHLPLALSVALALVVGLVVGAVVLWPRDHRNEPRDRAPTETTPTRPAPEAAAKEAIVAVSTSPEDAVLTVDGRPAGTAPAILEVPPGRHVIRAEAPQHRPAEREVQVAPGGRLAVQLALVAEESLPVDPPAPAEPSSDARRPSPAVVPAPGFLNVSSEPWARITIDGRATGLSTPARGIRLAPGPHVVELSNPVVGARKRFTVRIESGRTATHRVPLR